MITLGNAPLSHTDGDYLQNASSCSWSRNPGAAAVEGQRARVRTKKPASRSTPCCRRGSPSGPRRTGCGPPRVRCPTSLRWRGPGLPTFNAHFGKSFTAEFHWARVFTALGSLSGSSMQNFGKLLVVKQFVSIDKCLPALFGGLWIIRDSNYRLIKIP